MVNTRSSCGTVVAAFEKSMTNTSGPLIIYILQILCNINEFETSQLNLRRLELSATMLKIVKYMMTLKVAKNI